MVATIDKEPLVLVFDIGTQSTRGFIFNKHGEILCSSKVETSPFFSNRIGYAEKNTEEYWNTIVSASNQLKDLAGKLWDRVDIMAVTTIRNTCAFLDKDVNPVRPTITWLDQRLAGTKQRFNIIHKVLYNLGGCGRVAYKQRRMSPTTWLKENEPKNWAKIATVCNISAYINYKFTGNLTDSTASQAGRLPYNYKREEWMKKSELTYEVFNCDREKLCNLAKPLSILGYITCEASAQTGIREGLEVVTTGSDKGCETLGLGCLDKSVASISFGTTASIQFTTDKYIEPQSFLPAYDSVVPGKYNPEIQIFRGYWMVTWFKEQFAEKSVDEAKAIGMKPEEYLDTMLSRVPAGSDGLILQPFWAPSIKNPEAKGAMIGFNDYHTSAHFYKAIIEGIDYALYNGYEGLKRRTGNNIKRLAVSGGGSQSDAVCQITADVFGLPVSRVQTYETSGLGAAILAFWKLGVYNSASEAVENMVSIKDTFYPKKENHVTYMRLYNAVYKKLYKRLQPLYNDLYDIVNKN